MRRVQGRDSPRLGRERQRHPWVVRAVVWSGTVSRRRSPRNELPLHVSLDSEGKRGAERYSDLSLMIRSFLLLSLLFLAIFLRNPFRMSVLNNVAFLPTNFDTKLFPGESTHPSSFLLSKTQPASETIALSFFSPLQVFPPTFSLTQDGLEPMLLLLLRSLQL